MVEKKSENNKCLIKLFRDAWDELRCEKSENIDNSTVEIITTKGKKKKIPCAKFWIKMIKDVEEQKKSPNYLYTPEADQKIAETFKVVFEYPSKDEASFYAQGMYYTPRSSTQYLENLHLGFDQWFLVQKFPPNPKVIKILRCSGFDSSPTIDNYTTMEIIKATECKSPKNSISSRSIDLTSLLSEDKDTSKESGIIDLISLDSDDTIITAIEITDDGSVSLSNNSVFEKYWEEIYTPLDNDTDFIYTPIYVDDSQVIQLPDINSLDSHQNILKLLVDNDFESIKPLIIVNDSQKISIPDQSSKGNSELVPYNYSQNINTPIFEEDWGKVCTPKLDINSDGMNIPTPDLILHQNVHAPLLDNTPIFVDDSQKLQIPEDNSQKNNSLILADNSQNINNDAIFQYQNAEYMNKWQRKMTNRIRTQFTNRHEFRHFRRCGFNLPKYSWLSSTSLHQIHSVPIRMPFLNLNPQVKYPAHWPHQTDSVLIYIPATCLNPKIINPLLGVTDHQINQSSPYLNTLYQEMNTRLPGLHKYIQMPYSKPMSNWTINGTQFLQPLYPFVQTQKLCIPKSRVIGTNTHLFKNRQNFVILMSTK